MLPPTKEWLRYFNPYLRLPEFLIGLRHRENLLAQQNVEHNRGAGNSRFVGIIAVLWCCY